MEAYNDTFALLKGLCQAILYKSHTLREEGPEAEVNDLVTDMHLDA